MKAVLLCDGSANQRALANRLASVVQLREIGIVVPAARPAKRGFARFAAAAAGLPFRRAWFRLLDHYDRAYPRFPDVETSSHDGVNAATVFDLIERHRPDCVLVSGTDLLRRPLIEAIHRTGRVMNLHTGLSPYIKGAPNCTNWALALGEFDLIGNTVMWLDAGIDSGHVIATERTPLTGEESLFDLHLKVMDHAHDLYCRSVGRLVAGDPLPAVPQASLGKGRLFLSRDWKAPQILRALLNFRFAYSRERLRPRPEVELVDLDAASRLEAERSARR